MHSIESSVYLFRHGCKPKDLDFLRCVFLALKPFQPCFGLYTSLSRAHMLLYSRGELLKIFCARDRFEQLEDVPVLDVTSLSNCFVMAI